jgi:hypothetical protein
MKTPKAARSARSRPALRSATVRWTTPATPDRDTHRTVRSDEAGLGGGLDQAEEAQRGVNQQKK